MISFRPMIAADRQFVLSGWSSSFRTSIYAGLISNARWADVMHREFGEVIDAPTTSVIVACEPGELDHEGREFLYGFIATRNRGEPYVYYAYVKKPYRWPRPFRIGHRLFDAAGIDPAEPFTYAAGTAIGDKILATCRCGRHRHDHDGTIPCGRFQSKYRGTMDPVPTREAA